MSETAQLKLTAKPELFDEIERRVEAGFYNSKQEFILAAVREKLEKMALTESVIQ